VPDLGTAPAVFEIGLILLLAVGAGWLSRRLGLPAIIGYLLVGVAVSPFTPGYVANRGELELLADVGVVLLLFEVGIEIDPLRLGPGARGLIWMAPLQVVLTTLCAGVGLLALGLTPPAALLVGLSVAMSSSVVVINITRSKRRTTNRATVETLLAWSVLQDLASVGLALVVLAALGLGSLQPLPAMGALAIFVILALAAAWLLPRLLHGLRSEHDLFLLLSVGAGLGLAGLGARFFGVPLAIAAFIAGLAIGESPAAAEARRRILPFRDLFAVLFFVLLGSLIEPARLPAALPWMAVLLAAVLLAKVLPTFLLASFARLPEVRPWQIAVGLGQLGEFSFVLATIVLGRGLIPDDLFTAILATVVVTIAVSTVLVRLGKRVEPVLEAQAAT
jgi:monovalent cation:H+ antiporter-2, CPA2 family